jgi:cbb3-type cytochrome oxidase subunit 3
MDAPVWSNDVQYFWEFVATIIITALMIAITFYISRKADRERAARKAACDAAGTRPAGAATQSAPLATAPRYDAARTGAEDGAFTQASKTSG